jgi:hypothetical protein
LYNPIAGIAAIAALLTSPWVNKYRLWLTIPATVLDSFKHEQAALQGAVYCATADALIEGLHDGGLITLKADANGHDLDAYRLDSVNQKQVRVPGVNRCKQQQPVRPSLADETPTPYSP